MKVPLTPVQVEDYVTDRSEVEGTINSFKEMISYVPSTRHHQRHPHFLPKAC